MRAVLADEVSEGLRDQRVVAAKGKIDQLRGMLAESGTGLEPCDDGGSVLGSGLEGEGAFAVLWLRVLVIGFFPAVEYHKKLKITSLAS